jgi:tRNA(Arg) A34 adenosine deaminase TadA
LNALNSINRRDFLTTTALAFGGLSGPTHTRASDRADGPPLPEGILPGDPLAQYWNKHVSTLVDVQLPRDLALPAVQERHRIYALLLMALVARFWNGNNNGPLGVYRFREAQKAADQGGNQTCIRYRGDLNERDDAEHISWDRYLGHNIACIAVDAKGEIVDFDFNHNAILRSSAEHAESRMVRRLFSLTDLIDDWNTAQPIPSASHSIALKGVTIYTSLESCAQCSGVMSLARIEQVVYLQNDPGAYRIGNIMYNLAGRDERGAALAALPIPASAIGLECLRDLNESYEDFRSRQTIAKTNNDTDKAYFVPCSGSSVQFNPSITSFLCTDMALNVFRNGASEFQSLMLREGAFQNKPDSWSNARCLAEARRFFEYADVEGFRGSPHKL